jgi:hypothetical protein
LGGLIFLVLACVSLYRLLFWFPIAIGGQQVGQVASLFAFAICAALCLILLRAGIATSQR